MQLESNTYGTNGGSGHAWSHGFYDFVQGSWARLDHRRSPQLSRSQTQLNTSDSVEYGVNPLSSRETRGLPDIDWLYVVRTPGAPSSERAFEADSNDLCPRVSGPIQFVNGLLETWGLRQSDATLLLGFEPVEWPQVERVLNGTGSLSGRDVKDRIACLFEIRRTLSGLFKNRNVENAWLRESHPLLNEQKPLDLLLEGSMENLLLVRDYVELAAGR